MRSLYILAVLSILIFNLVFAGTTGKIVGTVTDARTGEKLVAANVVVQALNVGAATNVDGYYIILNVSPGTYRMRASLVGYTSVSQVDVRVEIDQTTTANFAMSEETVQAQEVVIVAERPVVQKDVSASRANITAATVQQLPIATVAAVVGLQAGIQANADGTLIVRGSGGTAAANGGGAAQTQWVLDGQSLRDGRDNSSFTGISLTSIENIQVQAGGYTAEYGNVRSGLVNVVTREGSKTNYTFSFLGRFSPARQKYYTEFGSPYDKNSYWIRPYVDPAVCWTGTQNGAWDAFTRQQYQIFEGWNSIAQKTIQNNDPTKPETLLDDLTPEAAQRLFLFQHRRQAALRNSDYDADMSFGGPVPGISEYLGNLRFLASYRQSTNYYVIPLSDDAYRDYTGQLKLTADIGEGMKLVLEGLLGRQTGTNDNNSGNAGIFASASDIASNLTIGGPSAASGVGYIDARIFGTDYWCPTTIYHNMEGVKFTHVISPTTFYSATFHRFETQYRTGPDSANRSRDIRRLYLFGNSYYADEAPFGFPNPYTPITGGIGSRMNMDLGWGSSRDTSNVATYNLKFDYTSQLDRYNQAQAGFEFIYTDNDVNYASVDVRLPAGRSRSRWHTYPIQGAIYLQDKLEFEGMIANLGLRLDYSNPQGNWFSSLNLYDPRYADSRSLGLDSLLTDPTKKIFTLSPRLGIAFPVTENSKLFFNYGHFRALPVPEDLFLIRRYSDNNAITRLADPNKPLPKTVSYELGYEQNLFDQFLLRVTGYYQDITDESKLVTYTSKDNTVNYSTYTSNRYRDVRGFELTASKNRGDWIQGFVNYTYDVRSNGFFGLEQYYEDRGKQREYERDNVYQNKPTPLPYARANIDFFTPEDFGPAVAGHNVFGDVRINLVASWNSGFYFTWAGGGGTAGVENNVQWRDSYNVNMRISKNFRIARANVQFFVDVTNLFDTKRMSAYGFVDAQDYENYMKSLHLPAEIAGDEQNPKFGYPNHPGNDRPGDFRTVPYKPFDPNNPNPDDKSYIDMPNQSYLAFLNPRDIYYGLRFSFDL